MQPGLPENLQGDLPAQKRPTSSFRGEKVQRSVARRGWTGSFPVPSLRVPPSLPLTPTPSVSPSHPPFSLSPLPVRVSLPPFSLPPSFHLTAPPPFHSQLHSLSPSPPLPPSLSVSPSPSGLPAYIPPPSDSLGLSIPPPPPPPLSLPFSRSRPPSCSRPPSLLCTPSLTRGACAVTDVYAGSLQPLL